MKVLLALVFFVSGSVATAGGNVSCNRLQIALTKSYGKGGLNQAAEILKGGKKQKAAEPIQ